MKRFSVLLVAILAVSFLTGCVMPGGGTVYAPLMFDVKGAYDVGDSDVSCEKIGTAEATGIICFTQGDSSIQAAMENAQITKIHHVDFKVTNILNIYAKWETVVYGE